MKYINLVHFSVKTERSNKVNGKFVLVFYTVGNKLSREIVMVSATRSHCFRPRLIVVNRGDIHR